MRFRVYFKVAPPRVIEAASLREAQDKAAERWPWSVIYVQELPEADDAS